MLFLIFFLNNCFAQEIVNVVMVNKKGITEKAKEAEAFIIIKKFNDHFQRLDYKMHAPLVVEKNFNDSNLTVLDGRYNLYHTNGMLSLEGEYVNSFKENTWNNYNDTGKLILQIKYLHNLVIETINPDTLKKEDSKRDILNPDEIEATYGQGKSDWKKYLEQNLNPDVALNSLKGGDVSIKFVIDTQGRCTNIMVKKSVEFVLDEEVKRLIYISPLWNSASQKGRKVKAYRIQPITFIKQE